MQEFDRGSEGDALLGRELEAVGQGDREACPDTFAGAFEQVGGGLAQVPGRAGRVGEDLLDQHEVVAAWGSVRAGEGNGERTVA